MWWMRERIDGSISARLVRRSVMTFSGAVGSVVRPPITLKDTAKFTVPTSLSSTGGGSITRKQSDL